MGKLRVAISLIDEHDDELVLSKRIFNDIWTIIPKDTNDLRVPSKLVIEEISYILGESVKRNMKESIKEMVEELMNQPKGE